MPSTPMTKRRQSARIVEIRSYNLKPGTRDRFHCLFVKEALPMLQCSKFDVIAYGSSLHDADEYFLMRGFSSLEDREHSEDAFYGSDEWRRGPREARLIAALTEKRPGLFDVVMPALQIGMR
jgi:hypothetical protein